MIDDPSDDEIADEQMLDVIDHGSSINDHLIAHLSSRHLVIYGSSVIYGSIPGAVRQTALRVILSNPPI